MNPWPPSNGQQFFNQALLFSKLLADVSRLPGNDQPLDFSFNSHAKQSTLSGRIYKKPRPSSRRTIQGSSAIVFSQQEPTSSFSPASSTTSAKSGSLLSEDESQRTNRKRIHNAIDASDEARQKLAKIVNYIGDFICKLCKTWFPDAFELAGHACSQMVRQDFSCDQCKKGFSCPANLASHRRWHKISPKKQVKNSCFSIESLLS
ncbi:hypothetical protein Ciccas_007481 [Cichlidogyrus casuarinus]|uniref:C2H2-type domain-containing protein n=1 Tax=Cichlidogyrus casuarinus TaxID=1844966 RepID=A0ABD2Q6R8_9PLAT